RYEAQLSTEASFSPLAASSITRETSASFAGLEVAATYYARARAFNEASQATDFFVLGSTATREYQPPLPAAPPFPAVSTGSLQAAWLDAGNPSSATYLVEKAESADFNANGSSMQVSGLSAAFSPLSPNTTYWVRASVYQKRSSTWSAPVVLGSTVTRALAPGALQVQGVELSSIAVAWADGGNPAGTVFGVEASTDSSFASLHASTRVAGGSALFGLGGAGGALAANATYYLRVKAVSHAGADSAYSAEAATPTLAAVPGAGSLGAVAAASLTASWGANGNAGGTEYLLELSTVSGWTPLWGAVTVTTQTSPVIGGLAANTTYYGRVFARSFSGRVSAFRDLGTARTLAQAPGVGALGYGVYPASVTLRWDVGVNAAYTEYRAQRSGVPDFSVVEDDTGWAPLAGAADFTAGVARNTTYYFRVKARDLSFEEAPAGADWTVLPSTETLVDPPGFLAREVYLSSAVARWSRGANPAYTDYLAERSTDAAYAGGYASSAWLTNGNVYAFTGLGANQPQHMRVVARNTSGVSSPRLAVSSPVYTLAEAPGQPAGAYVRTGSTLLVSWSAGSNPSYTAFDVERSTRSDFAAAVSSSGWLAQNSYSFGGLSPGTTHFFRVKARNQDALETDWTGLPSTATLFGPNPPTGLAVSFADAFSTDRLQVGWVDNSFDEDSFTLERSTDGASWSFAKTLAAQSGAGPYAYVNGPAADAALEANARYFYRVYATNVVTSSAYSSAGSRFTRAAAPAAASPAVGPVWTSSATASFLAPGNPSGTLYRVLASTAALPNAFGGNASSETYALAAALSGLAPNTTYFLGVEALNGDAVASALASLGSTVTAAAVPAAAASAFSGVAAGALAVHWSSAGNPGWTRFEAQLSTEPGFAPVLASSITRDLSAAFSTLAPQATYYARVRAINDPGQATGFLALGSTRTVDFQPPAPAEPAFSGLSTGSVAVAWDAMGNPPGALYQAQLALDAGFGSVAGSTETVALAAAFGGLAANTTYYARAAVYQANASTWSAPAVLGSTITLPLPPSGVAVLTVDVSSISLGWALGGNPALTLFEAESSTDGFLSVNAATRTASGTLARFGLGWAGSPLTPNTTGHFRVRTISHSGAATGFSAAVSTPTLAASPGAGALSGATGSSLSASWDANGNPAGTEYLLEVSTTASFAPLWTPVSATTQSTRLLSGLAGNTVYFGRVSARNFAGRVGEPVGLTSARTAVQAPAAAPVPYGVYPASVTVRWDPGTNAASTEYRAQRSAAASFALIEEDSGWGVFGSSYAFTVSLLRNATYYFRAKARDALGAEAPSGASWTVLASTQTAVDPPAFVARDLYYSSITVHWARGSNPAYTEYWVERAADAGYGAGYVSSGWLVNASSYSFSGAAYNEAQFTRVRARNTSGLETGLIDLISPVYTLAQAPEQPPASYLRGGSTLLVSWGTGANSESTEYYAERSPAADFSASGATSGWTTQNSWSFAGLSPGSTHYFRAKARNGDGVETGWTVLPSSATLFAPADPSGLATAFVDAVSVDRLQLTWQDNAIDEDFFTLERSTDGASWSFSRTLPAQLGVGVYSYLNGPPSDPALAINTRYFYRVRAANAVDVSLYTNVASRYTRTLAPAAGSPALEAVHESSAAANYLPNGNAAGTVYRLLASTGALPNAFAGNVSSETAAVSAVVSGMTPDTTYFLAVQSVNGDGTATSPVALGSTVTLAAAAGAPAVSAVGANAFTASWSAAGNPPTTRYLLEVSTGAFPNGFAGNASTVTTAVSARLTALAAESVYKVQVRALQLRGGFSAASAGPDTTTAALPLSTPTAPAPGAFVGELAPVFSWQGPSTTVVVEAGPGAAFLLEAAANAGFAPVVFSSAVPPVVLSASASVAGAYGGPSGLLDATTYWWRVRLRDTSGAVGASGPASTFVTDFSSPTLSAFRSFSSTGGAAGEAQPIELRSGVTAQVRLEDPVSGLSAQGGAFSVRFSSNAGGAWRAVTSTNPSATEPYLALTGVDGSTTAALTIYNLALTQSTSALAGASATNLVEFTASDRLGRSSRGLFSVLVETAPPAASMLSLTSPSSGSLRAVANATAGFLFSIQDYRLEVSTRADFASLAPSPFLAVPDHLFTGLLEGATYYGRVRARNERLALSAPSPALAARPQGLVQVSTEAYASVAQQGTRFALLRLALHTPSGATTYLQSLRVRQSGDASDGDVSSVRLYSDADGNGLFDSGVDVSLAAASMSGGAATLALPGSAALINGSPKRFFVVYELTLVAATDRSVGAAIDAAADLGFSVPFSASGPFPTETAPNAIQDGANGLTASAASLAPSVAPPGVTDLALLRLTLQTDQGSSILDRLVVRLDGTAASNDVSALGVWRDANGNGAFEPALDTPLSSGADSFFNGVATVAVSGALAARTVLSSPAQFFVAVSLAAGAVEGRTVSVRLGSAADVGLATPADTLAPFAPFASAAMPIFRPNALSAAFGSEVPADLGQGQAYTLLRATLTVDSGSARLNQLRLNRQGTGSDADLRRLSVYRDVLKDGGPFNPAADVFIGSATLSGGQAVIELSTVTVAAGAPEALFVLGDVLESANPGNTLGLSLPNATFLRIDNPFAVVTGTFPVTTALGTIRAHVNTVSVSRVFDTAPGSLQQGAADVAMLRLDVVSDGFPVSWSRLRVGRAGTAADAAVTALRLYRDINGDALLQPATDAMVASGSDFSGGFLDLGFATPELVTASTATYFLAVDVDPDAAPGPTVGLIVASTASLQLSAPNRVWPGPPAYPLTAGPAAIVQAPNRVQVSTASLAPVSGALSGAANVPLLKLSLQTDISSAKWSRLRLYRGGASADADVKAVKLYLDVNDRGSFDAASLSQYLLVSVTTATFGAEGAPGEVSLGLSPAQTLGRTSRTYFVVVDLSTGAVPGRTVTARVLSEADFSVEAPNSVAPTSFASEPLLVLASPSELFAQGASLAPASAVRGSANVPMLSLAVWMRQFSGQWSGLTVSRLGTGADDDVAVVRLLRDADGNGTLDLLSDVVIASGSFSGGLAALAFPAETITVATRTYFVACDLSGTAGAGGTVGAAIAGPGSLILGAPHNVNSQGLPFESARAYVSPTQAGLSVAFQDRAPAALLQGASVQLMMNLILNTTAESVLVTGVAFEKTGTAVDAEVTGLTVWLDADDDGVLDPARDTALGSRSNPFAGGSAAVTLAPGLSVGSALRRVFVSANIHPYADAGRTLGLSVSTSSAISLDSPNYVLPAGFPFATGLVALAKQPETLSAAVSSLWPGGVVQGYETPAFKLVVSASRHRVAWTQLRLAKVGTLGDERVSAARVYRDSDRNGSLGSADLLIGSGTFASGASIVALSSAQTVGPTAQTYFVSAVLDPDAEVGSSLGLSIANAFYVGVAAPDAVSSAGLPVQTPLATVQDGQTPTAPVVTFPEGVVNGRVDSIRFVWASEVALGALSGAEYAVGTTPGGQELVAFKPLGSLERDTFASGVRLASGATYYLSMRTTSSWGKTSSIGVSPSLFVDFVVPSKPQLTAQVGETSVVVQWAPSSSGPSGLKGYLVRYRRADSPRWLNAKTRQLLALGAAEARPAASLPAEVSEDDLVSDPSVLLSGLPAGTLVIEVIAVSEANLMSAPSDPLRIVVGALPLVGLSGVSNYPNPFDSRKERTTIVFTLNAASEVKMTIFDVAGRAIREQSINGSAGTNSFVWDGADGSGRKVSMGVYTCVIQALSEKQIRRIAVVH
ncbi:MAG: T9SS type A sorting domain-containing protein, partial [Elusimicrobia bacterium]|nr:T9SS type A sorting domain-containing protein [Elusimicrobiota bacterium]